AEDGIRDFHVTGVQTCALPIFLQSCLKEVISMLAHRGDILAERIRAGGKVSGAEFGDFVMLQLINRHEPLLRHYMAQEHLHPERSEERRVGKEGRSRAEAIEQQ